MQLPRDVPCRNKPEIEIIVAHPAIPERRRRSRPGKVQLTWLTKSALLQQPDRESDNGQILMRVSNTAPLLEAGRAQTGYGLSVQRWISGTCSNCTFTSM